MTRSYRVTIRYATEHYACCYTVTAADGERDAIQRVWNRHMRKHGTRYAFVERDERIAKGVHVVQMGWHVGKGQTALDGKVIAQVEALT